MNVSIKRFMTVLLAGYCSVAASAPSSFDETVETSGDLLQFAIPLTALGFTFFFGDSAPRGTNIGLADGIYQNNPALQSGELSLLSNVIPGSRRGELITAVGRAYVATYGLKYAIDAERPNGAGQSFPSGHTALSFTGAAFLNKHYGWKAGVPAYLAASYVGWSRVHSNNHYWSDVLAGAAIGIASNYFMGDPHEVGPGRLRLSPTIIPHAGDAVPGLSIGYRW